MASCKDIEGSICYVPLNKLGLDTTKSHTLEAVVRECSDKHGCSESTPIIIQTSPVTPGTDGQPTHKVYVTGGIVYSKQSTSFSKWCTPPPPNNINTAHRGRFQVNVNPIGDSK